MRTLILLTSSLFAVAAGAAEHTTMTYKSLGDSVLRAHIVSPDGHPAGAQAPAVVFFHGGGWRRGSPETGFPYGESLAEHGVVTIAVEYRFTDATTLDEIITDAQAAVRWTRESARRLGVDPEKIIAFGHSAGGHLAGATAMLPELEDTGGYERASVRPNALAMIAPYPATAETAGEHLPRGADPKAYEPREHVSGTSPPTLIIQGTEDDLVLPATSTAYHDALLAAGADSTLFVVDGVDHFFREEAAKARVSARLAQFIRDLGFID